MFWVCVSVPEPSELLRRLLPRQHIPWNLKNDSFGPAANITAWQGTATLAKFQLNLVWKNVLRQMKHSSHRRHFQTKQISFGQWGEFAWPTELCMVNFSALTWNSQCANSYWNYWLSLFKISPSNGDRNYSLISKYISLTNIGFGFNYVKLF